MRSFILPRRTFVCSDWLITQIARDMKINKMGLITIQIVEG